jgi:hypothetical protein
MTLGETLLSRLAESRRTNGDRYIRHTDTAKGWSVTVEVEKTDALSCQVASVTCERLGGVAPELGAWASALAKQVRGLMEPLRVVEIDQVRGEAILRSDAPTTRADRRAHFELHLFSNRKATLARYAAGLEPTSRRERVPFALTLESLGKLVDDMTQA